MKTIIVILLIGLLFGYFHAQARPDALLINEAKWTVRMVDEFSSDPELMGWTDIPKHEILLRKGMCLEQEQDTLWHELHHALMGDQFIDVKLTGHQFIYLLTPAELHVMRDNPRLVSYLTK